MQVYYRMSISIHMNFDLLLCKERVRLMKVDKLVDQLNSRILMTATMNGWRYAKMYVVCTVNVPAGYSGAAIYTGGPVAGLGQSSAEVTETDATRENDVNR